jgi:hypothetical protein
VNRSSIRFALAAALLLIASHATGQTPARGEGNFTTTYQHGLTLGQLNTAGQYLYPDSNASHSVIWDVEFGVTDRFAVHASLPYMAVRYVGGPNAHTIGIHGQPSTLDNGHYHPTTQDVRVGGSWSLIQSRRLSVAPFADGVIPSHHYESLGQSVVGRDLRGLVVGTTVSGFVDVLPGLYFQALVSHSFVQKVLSVRANQSNLDSEAGYFITPRVAARFIEAFQYTHNGIEFIGSRPSSVLHDTQQGSFNVFLNHDRLLMTRVLNLGGGVTVGLSDAVDVFASATKSTWGRNVQRDHFFTAGVNVHFRTR